jgi:hypothetical protein
MSKWMENVWSLLKRGLNGLTSAWNRSSFMKQIVGHRRTYKELTGKTEDAYG